MRRIKSAPKDLALMVNRKKFSPSMATPTVIESKENKIVYSHFKKQKPVINTMNNVAGDLLNKINIDPDESIIISLILSFISENVYKKDKVKFFLEFTIQTIVRYFMTHLLHKFLVYQHIIIPEFNKILHLSN
tara:strand:+ start:159 stop:557 length:399 start_codon:yes stop_codon:yes gene_type:complete